MKTIKDLTPMEIRTDLDYYLFFCQDIAKAEIGNSVNFGTYESEPILWRVLDKKDGRLLLHSEKVLFNKEYNSKFTSITWEKCTLRKYLNKEFIKCFSAEEQIRISKTEGGNNIKDKIFLLSIDEAKKYYAGDEDRVKYNSKGYSSWWWLRSPGGDSIFAAYVYSSGDIYDDCRRVDISDGGVVPAFWLNL